MAASSSLLAERPVLGRHHAATVAGATSVLNPSTTALDWHGRMAAIDVDLDRIAAGSRTETSLVPGFALLAFANSILLALVSAVIFLIAR